MVGVWAHKADQGFDKATGPAWRQCFIKRVDLWLIFFLFFFLSALIQHKEKLAHSQRGLDVLRVTAHMQMQKRAQKYTISLFVNRKGS